MPAGTHPLFERLRDARVLLSPCRACPYDCDVDRLAGVRGKCHVGSEIVVGSVALHFGEESCLVGSRGSGCIFFSGCNLACAFCQSHAISVETVKPAQPGEPIVRGQAVTIERLVQLALSFQSRCAATLNLISPTHYGPQVVELLMAAREAGLTIPVVYNCGGYEALPMLRLLDGLVDIYLPDIKTLDAEVARAIIGPADYPQRVREAVVEMHRQVGDLTIGPDGLATRGLLVRHLVMPNDTSTTRAVLDFVGSVSANSAVNVMDQYRPAFRAFDIASIARKTSTAEIAAAREYARALGLRLVEGGGRESHRG